MLAVQGRGVLREAVPGAALEGWWAQKCVHKMIVWSMLLVFLVWFLKFPSALWVRPSNMPGAKMQLELLYRCRHGLIYEQVCPGLSSWEMTAVVHYRESPAHDI